MGTPDYATKILQKLIKNYEVIALFAQPDKAVGRKQILTQPDTKKFILDNSLNIDIYQPEKLATKESVELLKKLQPDFIIVAAYGQILSKEILDIAPCINLHASLLPKYRGASPIQSSILNSDKLAGVTSMLMEEGLDSGDILGFKYIKLDRDIKVTELFEKLADIASELTIETIENFSKIEPLKQNSSISNYAKKIKREDGLISFNDSADEIYTKFRAFYFWPEIFLENGLKLKEINLIESQKEYLEVGKILQIDADGVEISTTKGSIKVSKLQAKSKKALNAIDYIRGKRLKVGDFIS